MIVNLDLLRIYLDWHEGMDAWERNALLSAAMPLVGNPQDVWAVVWPLVADLRGLDSKVALDTLKDRGTYGGGHDPQVAYDIVFREIEAEITATVCKTAVLARGATVTAGVVAA